ncbi:hypothetical protein BHE74_00023773 [Ensete ventricosum]|nr:hypothetical protein BHE74_00023773 [Ensete ventricosum]
MTGTLKWEIVHVPGEPEVSLEVSTVNVFASKIEPKLANKIARLAFCSISGLLCFDRYNFEVVLWQL